MLHICGLQIIFYVLYGDTFEKFIDLCTNTAEKHYTNMQKNNSWPLLPSRLVIKFEPARF